MVVQQFPQTDKEVVLEPKKEMPAFVRWWNQFKYYYSSEGKWVLYTEKHKEWAMKTILQYKRRTGLTFRGGNSFESGTFGVREIQVEDLSISGDANRWDHNYTTTGSRLWVGGSALDGGTFAAGVQGRTRDTSDRIWYVDIWGLQDLESSPGKPVRLFSKFGTQDHMTRYIEWAIRGNELRLYFLSERLSVREQPYKLGLDIRVAGFSQMRPLGITVAEFERLTNQDISTLSRPQAA